MKEFSKRDALIALAIRHRGDVTAIMGAIRRREGLEYEEIASLLATNRSKAITVFDPEYPEALLRIHPSPVVLFYRGDITLIRNVDDNVAIVGARECHTYAMDKTTEIAGQLAKRGMGIVSGLATGIDTCALQAGYPYGRAIAVIGNGMDYYYPSENRRLQQHIAEYGLLLSEYPDDVEPSPRNFVARNRIIAGLASLTIVAEAKLKSGSLITACFAASINHDVGAFPHDDNGDDGCNEIIKDGAFLISSINDVQVILGTRGEKFFLPKK